MKQLLVALLFVRLLTASAATLGREVSPFGVMLNDDGDFSFVGQTPEESVAAVEASVDALVGTPVKTLMYSVGAGSDTLYYPTKVASVVGWRQTRSDELADPPTDESKAWSRRIAMIRTGMNTGIDPIRVAGERAKEHGLFFVPSYRMNDNHFMFDPMNYPLTGKFWLDNHKEFVIGDSPILADDHYGNLLDYSHRGVREFRLAVIKEIIDRYGDVMDGIELDFNRVQVLFPRGKASERAHLITEMLQQVRTWLNAAEKKSGRKQSLFVRVPPTPKNCEWAGLDIAGWMKLKLVDVLLPSQLMTLSHDMPIDEFVAMAEPAGCLVCPSIYPRTSWGWGLVRQPNAESYSSTAKREVTPDLVRGAASNYWQMGAAGFQLFNFHHEDIGLRPYSDRLYRIMRDLADPQALNQANKVFAVTPAYYLDYEDSYEYRKQIPARLAPGERVNVSLHVGDNISQAVPPPRCVLRLGLSDVADSASLEVLLNGLVIHRGPLSQHYFKAGSHTASNGGTAVQNPPDAPQAYVQFEIESLSTLRRGPNDLTVSLKDSPNEAAKLVEVWLGVFYDRQYLKLIE